jgi:hypothetical protein
MSMLTDKVAELEERNELLQKWLREARAENVTEREAARASRSEDLLRRNCRISHEMGLRDRFAMAALSALLQTKECSGGNLSGQLVDVANKAYLCADEMLIARKR